MNKESSLEHYLCQAEIRIGKRICQLLEQFWQGEACGLDGAPSYEESLLTREIRNYFGELAGQQEEDVAGGCLLQRLYAAFQLDDFEQLCVEMAVLGEVNPWFEKFYVYMNNDWNSGFLTMETAVKLYAQGAVGNTAFCRYFLDGSGLMKYFLKAEQQEGKSWLRRGMRCRKALLQLLFSADGEWKETSFYIQWRRTSGMVSGQPEHSLLAKLGNIPVQNASVVYLNGPEESVKEKIVGEYAAGKGHEVCYLDIRKLLYLYDRNMLAEPVDDICRGICLWLKVRAAWLCIHEIRKEFWEKETNQEWTVFVLTLFRNQAEMLFVTGDADLDGVRQELGIWELTAEEAAGEAEERLSLWREHSARYPLEDGIDLEVFAAIYRFTSTQIGRVLAHADKVRLLEGNPCIRRGDLKKSCMRETCAVGNHLVSLMDSRYQWEDLVLPESQKEQLRAACSRVIHREKVYGEWGFGRKMTYGKGVSMVFSGSPGTGKTMAAGIVADNLGTALYRVDLAAVVSKYIGETEKNLNTVFESVRRGQGVLFFDEADVLFSRRTTVGSSNDKHSNMEAAYLLQKMEEYDGVVILATNYMQNMDEAFKRRFQFVVHFPFPDETQRKVLWEKAFPENTTSLEDRDYGFLAAQFELSGSQIRNIALQAAFFAADGDKKVDMESVIRALIMELAKSGKRVTSGELREYQMYYKM